jgi:hypothetical protein
MATLYKRASPPQHRMLRIVEGAFRDAAHVHGLEYPEHMPRSISKRAVGTLSSQWVETLAVQTPSVGDGVAKRAEPSQCSRLALVSGARRGASQLTRRSPLKKIIVHLSTQLRDIKKAGQTEKAEAFIEVLKFIHGLKNSH